MPIKKSINAVIKPATLDTLRKLKGKIYVDERNLQRLINKWDDETASKHFAACLNGHSNIYTIVFVSISGCIEYCQELIQEFSEGEPRYESVKETIEYLSKLQSDGYVYINIDGQHRVDCYGRYLASQFYLRESVVNVIDTNKGKMSEDFKGKLFKELNNDSQNEILKTPLTIVVVNKGTLTDLVDITIYTNIGEPWNEHEMRIIIPSYFNRYLADFMNDNPLMKSMFKHTKGMDGAYSLLKKGDSLIICEWFAYYYNIKEGNYYVWPTKSKQLDEQSSIEGLPKASKSKLNEAKGVISKTIEVFNNCGSTKHERSFLDNLFIFMCILETPNHILNPYGKQISITDMKAFYDWFAKAETKCRVEDFYVRDKKGNIVIERITGKKMTNSESFKRKCGAKKTDDIQLRSTKLMQKFSEAFDKLFADGVITLIDTTNYTKADKLEAAIEADWIDADGQEFTFEELMGSDSIIEGDHNSLARAKGGETKAENLKLRRKKANIRKSDKTIAN